MDQKVILRLANVEPVTPLRELKASMISAVFACKPCLASLTSCDPQTGL